MIKLFLFFFIPCGIINAVIIKIDESINEEKMIQAAVDIANSEFEFLKKTIVISRDIDCILTDMFLQNYKGSVIVESIKNGSAPAQVVILVQSYCSFVNISEISKLDLSEKSLLYSRAKFLIVVFSNPHRLESMTGLLWNYYATDVEIIVKHNTGNIALYTYFPYKNTSSCHNIEPNLLGFFGEIKFDSKILYPDKMGNMNGCPLYISTTKVYHPSTENKVPLQIIKRSMHIILTDIMNSTSKIINRKYTSIDSNNALNWLESLNDVITGEANISTSTVALGFDKADLLDYSVPYFRIRLAWIAPPTTTGPTLWKLLTPLNGYLWLLLLILSIFVKTLPYALRMKRVRRLSYRYFKNFNKMQGITFRIWGVMMGQPIRIAPRRFRDFYIISLWLWFTFFVRSAYQSVLIRALKTDTIVGNYADLQEAVNDGFTFGGRSGILGYFEYDPLICDGFKVVPDARYEKTFQDVLDSKNKFVIATSLEYAWTFCYAEAISEKDCGYVLPDSILMVPLVVWMQKSSPFLKPLSVWLPRLIESGLLNKDAEQKPLKDVKTPDPSPLSSKQASSCFLFLVLGYIISIIVFVGEIFKNNSRTVRSIYKVTNRKIGTWRKNKTQIYIINK